MEEIVYTASGIRRYLPRVKSDATRNGAVNRSPGLSASRIVKGDRTSGSKLGQTPFTG